MINQQRLFMYCRGGLRYCICFILLFAAIAAPVLAAEQTDGSYTISYEIKKAEDDSASMANDYFEKPATIRIKDDITTVEITLNHSDWITEFKVPKGDSYADAAVISKDTAADKRVVSFQVKNLMEPLLSKIHVTVPSIDYDHDYTIRLVFEQNSMKLVKAETPVTEKTPEKTEATEIPNSKPSDDPVKSVTSSDNKVNSISKEQGKTQSNTSSSEKKQAVTAPKADTSSSEPADSGKVAIFGNIANNDQKKQSQSTTNDLATDKQKNESSDSSEATNDTLEESKASSQESSSNLSAEPKASDEHGNTDNTAAGSSDESQSAEVSAIADVHLNTKANDISEEAVVPPVTALTSIKENGSGIWWFIITASALGVIAVFEIRRRRGKAHTKK